MINVNVHLIFSIIWLHLQNLLKYYIIMPTKLRKIYLLNQKHGYKWIESIGSVSPTYSPGLTPLDFAKFFVQHNFFPFNQSCIFTFSKISVWLLLSGTSCVISRSRRIYPFYCFIKCLPFWQIINIQLQTPAEFQNILIKKIVKLWQTLYHLGQK